jgi:hypothetical protein
VGVMKVGKESVVLLLDGIREGLEERRKWSYDVEAGELVFALGVDPLDVGELAICDLGKITI